MGALTDYYKDLDASQRVACVDALIDLSDFVAELRTKRLAREKKASELGITYNELIDQINAEYRRAQGLSN